jgi:N-acetylglutamate synthase-like GNAT family acetyltransferase
MKIRPATKREVGKFFRAVNRSHMRSETVLLSASRLALADEFFVAIVNRKIVGAVCLVLDNGECAELLTEYVLKAYHGRGIGTRLTRTGIERLISLGRTPIFVDVAGKGMDRTLDKLPARLRRHLRLERAYLKYGEVELPER